MSTIPICIERYNNIYFYNLQRFSEKKKNEYKSHIIYFIQVILSLKYVTYFYLYLQQIKLLGLALNVIRSISLSRIFIKLL